LCVGFALVVLGGLAPRRAAAQVPDPSLWAACGGGRWAVPRQAVFRRGGIPGNPAVYYIGTPGGGVWETTDGGTGVEANLGRRTRRFHRRHRSGTF